MVRSIYRKTLADLSSQRLQFSLILIIVAAATMMLTIALLVQRSADDPWDRTFAATNGPHVWLASNDSFVDFSAVVNVDGVTGSTGEIPATFNHPIVIGTNKHEMFLYGMAERPEVARPQVVEGRWLSDGDVDEIVLDFSLAKYYGLMVEGTVDVLTAEGPRSFHIVGLSVTSHFIPYTKDVAELTPGMAYVLPATLEEIEPDPSIRVNAIGLRLEDPDTSGEFIQHAHVLLENRLISSIDWKWVRQMATFGNQMSVLFLGFLSMIGLVAAGFIIANAIGGHVVANYRDIGLLKAIGFTPSQVWLMFLVEHLIVGLLGIILGLGLGIASAPAFTSPIAEVMNAAPPSAVDPVTVFSIIILVGVAVILFTLLPAWHGSRIDTVRAISVGFRNLPIRSSRIAGVVRRIRLPSVVVLGVKDTFSNPRRAFLTVVGLVLTVIVAMFAVGAQASIEDLTQNTTYFHGTPAEIQVDRGFRDAEDTEAMLLDRPEIVRYYGEWNTFGWLPGSNEPVLLRALNENYRAFDFGVVEGRMIRGPNEAIVAYGLLDLAGRGVGDELVLIVDGQRTVFQVVGRYMEMANLGRVMITDLDTYRQQVDPSVEPQLFSLDLISDADVRGFSDGLMEQSDGQFDVFVTDDTPNSSTIQIRGVIIGLGSVLTVIATINLLSTMLLGVRERTHDFGIQKTLGCTPAQIAISIAVGASVLSSIGLALGIPLGLLVYDVFLSVLGHELGTGPEFGKMSVWLLWPLIPGMVLLALASSAFPAWRAARLEVTSALRYD